MAASAVAAAHAPNPLEFIHIPKTGGQAIEAWGLHHGLAWGGCRLKAGGPSWPVHPGRFGSYTKGCSSFHIPPAAWEAAQTPPFAAGAPTFCVVRHPFTRAVSEYQWQAKWTPYWRACTAANLNEFIERVFVSGIDPHGGDDEPAEGGGAAGAAAESGSEPTGPHVPPGLGARLAALRSAGELATMEAPPSELDCHALPQWVYIDGLERGRPACQHVLSYESLEEDFAALIGTVDAATARAAAATALTAAADGATAAAAAAAADADPNAKMREELERLKRMLRREESDVHDALQQTDKLGWEIDSSRPCNSTSGDKGAGSEAASTISTAPSSTATSSTATSSGASGEMYRSFNLSYARGELSRHGDVRGGCGISVSDLSSASRAILTMAYAADFARLGYDPLDLGRRPRLQTSATDLGYGPLDRGAEGADHGADRGADGRGPSEVAAGAEEGARRAARRRAAASARRRSASAGSAVLLAPVTGPASLPTLPTLPSRGSDFCEMS